MEEHRQVTSAASTRIVSIMVNIFWVLGWVAAALSVAVFLLVVLTDFNVKFIHLPIEVSFDEPAGASGLDILHSARSLPIVGFRDLVVEADRAAFLQKYVLFIPLALAAGYLWIVFQLRAFLRTIRGGNPFVRDNPKRIRKIGYTLIVGAPIIGILSNIYARLYMHLVEIPGATLTATMDVYPFVIFLGLVILVIAHVFDVGAKLQTEQDLTI